MVSSRYIIFHDTKVGEQVAYFDEGEEKEVLKELKALGKAYFVYDKKTKEDYTYIQFKKKSGIKDSFDTEKRYRGIKYSFYRNVYRIELEKRDYIYCESEKEVFDIIDAYLRNSFKMRFKDSYNVDPKNIFYMTTTENGSYYDDLLNGSGIDRKKNAKAKVIYMTPNEYYEKCVDIFNTYQEPGSTIESVKKGRIEGKNADGSSRVGKLEEAVLNGNKLGMAYLDYKNGGQEGLHRMMAAANLTSWNTKFPVLIVEPYKILTKEELHSSILKWINDDIDKNEYYDEEKFGNKVWEVITNRDEDIKLDKIEVEIRYHSMNIWFTYAGNEYQLAFSLRDPQNLRNDLFHIYEYHTTINHHDYGIDDLTDEDLKDEPSIDEDLYWENYDD